MAVEVVTAATNFLLSTVAIVQSEIPALVGNDARAERLLTAASERITTYLCRILAKQTYRETLPGYGTQRLILKNTPVLRLDAVPIVVTHIASGQVIEDWTLEHADRGFLFRDRGWEWSATVGGIQTTGIPGTEVPAFEVLYPAGYVLPGDAVGAGEVALEPTIQEAVISITALLSNSPALASQLENQVSIGKMSVSLKTGTSGVRATELEITNILSSLSDYRRKLRIE